MSGDIVSKKKKGKAKNSSSDSTTVSPHTSLIWCLHVLKDGSLTSGDSRGQLQIWDTALGVLVCTFKQHLGDVLAVAASGDGRRVFSAGLDGKVCCVELVSGPGQATDGQADQEEEWVHTYAHRAHSHDVHALAVQGSFLLSGGVDSKLCTYSVSDFAAVRPRWIPLLPANRLVQHDGQYRTLALQQRHAVELWRLTDGQEAGPDSGGLQMKVKVELKGDEHIHSVALAPLAASLLAVSTATGTRLWRVRAPPAEGEGEASSWSLEKLRLPNVPTKYSNPNLKDEFCQAMCFSADDTLFAVRSALLA